jgi:MFS transporter, OFA family, oxalate/formate antiporter
MATNATSFVRTEPKIANRWVQMCACGFAMVAIANLQYVWTSYIKPLTVCLNAGLATIEVAFAVLIPTQIRLVPVEDHILHRLSRRVLLAIGGVFVGVGWVGTGLAPWCAGSS